MGVIRGNGLGICCDMLRCIVLYYITLQYSILYYIIVYSLMLDIEFKELYI